jgi:ferrous iron transport protein A
LKNNIFFDKTIEYMFMHLHKHHHRRRRELIPDSLTRLTDLEEGQKGIILEIAGGKHSSKRLADLGLAPGVEITMTTTSFFSGPLQISVCGSKLVIGHGLASRILIEPK